MSKRIDIDILQSPKCRITTIGGICDEFGGDVQTGPFGSQLHAADYSVEGVPVVMPQDMVDGRIICDRIARVAPEHVQKLSRHVLREGDLVFSRRGDVSRFAVVTAAEAGWLCGTGSIRIRLNCAEILTGYARRYLQQAKVGAWLLNEAKGITMPNLNTKIIRALPFVYPPVQEQRRIAAILDQADALRAKRRAALAQLDSLTQSIFNDLIVKSSSEVQRITIEDCMEAIIDYRGKTPVKTQTGIPLITARVVKGRALLEPDEFIAESDYVAWMRRGMPKPGDVLFTTEAPLGEVAQLDTRKVALAQRLLLLRGKAALLDNTFLMFAMTMHDVRSQIEKRATGSTVKGIRQAELRKVEIPIPPLKMQREFTARIKHIEGLRTSFRESLSSLNSLFAALQHRAFRGEL